MPLKRKSLIRNRVVTSVSVHRLGLAEWLSIAQLIALLLGGGWAAFVFWKFDARDKEIAYQKAQIELKHLQANPLKISPQIVIAEAKSARRKPGQTIHNVSILYSLENTTPEAVQVTLVLVQVFALPPLNVSPGKALQLISADQPQSNSQLLLSKVYLADGETIEGGGKYKSTTGQEFEPFAGGGGTGSIDSKDDVWVRFELLANDLDAEFIEVFIEAIVRFPNGISNTMTVRFPARFEPGSYSPMLHQPESKRGAGRNN